MQFACEPIMLEFKVVDDRGSTAPGDRSSRDGHPDCLHQQPAV